MSERLCPGRRPPAAPAARRRPPRLRRSALHRRARRTRSRHRRQLAHDDLRLGDRRLAELRPHAAQRAHLRRAAVHRRERLLADLRPHARRQHGVRLVLSRRWLHRLRGAAEDDRLRFHDPGHRTCRPGSGCFPPSSRRLSSVSSASSCSRSSCSWNQGQELRQALITIAISVIIADQVIAHFNERPRLDA